ncbi:MAG: hypothetical protein JNM08_15170 [Rubrivivax sp.]|nr:hypothetical protein [Rubrivivax sp.]
MLPRIKQWLETALGDRPSSVEADEESLSVFVADDRLEVSESTITEFSRTIAVYQSRPSDRG